MRNYLFNVFFLAIFLLPVSSSIAQTPSWIKIIGHVEDGTVVSNAPFSEVELAGMLMPKKSENLIGTKIELNCSSNLMFHFAHFGHFWNSMLIETFYKYKGTFLNMNQASKQDNSMPTHMIYTVGMVDGLVMKEKPLIFTVSWKDAQTGNKTVGTITGSIYHYYDKQDFTPAVEVFSKKGKPLKSGLVHFERLGPGDHGELQADFEIKDGKVQHYTGLPLSAGHYSVSLEKPEKCAKTFNENLIIFPDDIPNADTFHFKASCEQFYNIYAYYNAPGFVKAGVVWRNSQVVFPDEDKDIQVFDVMAYENGSEQGEPKGTDGKKLHLPYSMTMPMIGKQTFYGHPEDEYETPELLYAKTLGAIPAFRLNKKHNALNICHIASTNGGPIHLELSIDLAAGSDGEYPEQFRIYCDNTLAHANLPAFPINFKVIRFTKEDIEKFKKFEKVEKTVSNGKATLKVVFEPEKSKNN